MVTISRYDRHLLDDRAHRLFKPALPLPFGVTCTTCFYKVTWEHAKLSLWRVSSSSNSCLTSCIHIFLVLYMRVCHIDERKLLTCFRIIDWSSSEMRHLTPVALCTHAIGVRSIRSQPLSDNLMAGIFKLRTHRQACSSRNT